MCVLPTSGEFDKFAHYTFALGPLVQKNDWKTSVDLLYMNILVHLFMPPEWN